MTNPVMVTIDNNIAVVKLNRPAMLNAVNSSMRAMLIDALKSLNSREGVRCVVITGEGERAFCAGQDLDEAGHVDWQDIVPWLQAQRDMYQAVRDLDKPCIAALNGVAAGAGFQIALCTDYRIAAEQTRLGQPEVKAGLASIVGTYLMTLHIGSGHNTELSLLGDLISGRRAYEIGLVNQLSNTPLDEALGVAARFVALPDVALRLSKQRLRAMTQPGFDEACTAGIRAQLECYASGQPQSIMKSFVQTRKNRGIEH